MFKEIDKESLAYMQETALYQLRKQWTDEERELEVPDIPFDEDTELEPVQDDLLNETLW